MKERSQIHKFLLILMCCILVVSVYSVFINIADSDYDVQTVKSNWNITYKGKMQRNVDIDTFQFRHIEKGDEIILSTNLPAYGHKGFTLSFYCLYSAVNVLLDGKSVYKYSGQDYMNAGGNHIVRTTEEFKNKKLVIHIRTERDGAFWKLKAPMIGYEYNIYQKTLSKDLGYALICLMLIMFGLFFTCITIVFMLGFSRFYMLFYVSLFSIATGVWGLANNGILQIISDNLSVVRIIEYLSLYVVPITLVAIIKAMFEETNNKLKIFRIFLVVDILFFVVVVRLHRMQLVHISETIFVAHAIYAIEIIITMVFYFRMSKEDKKDLVLPFLGLLVYVFTVFTDMIGYVTNRFIERPLLYSRCALIPYGAIIFVITILVYYGNTMIQNVYQKNEREKLLGLAYHDDLTNLYNRAKCYEHLEMLQKKGIPYGIISFDLNGLKILNDTKGHQLGDWLIIKYSSILHQSFARRGVVCRVGGDEFLVIIETRYKSTMEGYLEQYRRLLDSSNRISKDMTCSASYGYAFSNEAECKSYNDVINLADMRMYKMKQAGRVS